MLRSKKCHAHPCPHTHAPPPNLLPRSAAGGYTLLLECARLLLALGSSVLYSPSARGQLGQHPYLDSAMQQKDLANSSEWGAVGCPLSMDGWAATFLTLTPVPSSSVVEALLRYFITAPPVPLRTKVYHYIPYDTRSALRIVRTAAGTRSVQCAAQRCVNESLSLTPLGLHTASAPLTLPPFPLQHPSSGCPTRPTHCCCDPSAALPLLARQALALALPPQPPPRPARWATARCCCCSCCSSTRRRK